MMLRHMLTARGIDEEAGLLENQGALDLWLSCRGQEAAQVGSAMAIGDEAVIFPSYREHAVAVVRGIDAVSLAAQWAGRTFCGWNPCVHRFFPYTLVLAAQTLHAVGYAIGQRLQNITENVVVYVGDGATSEGDIDEFGLAPARFVEKRFRREASTTTFNRETHAINFTQSTETYPLKGGEQDRTSIIWQLISVARGAPDKFTNGSEWLFFVAGPRDAEQWSFKVVGREKIKTKQGEVNAVHIFRAPPPDDKSQKLDIWLAPSSDWYPVRLRFTDPDGDFIEQTLDNVSKK